MSKHICSFCEGQFTGPVNFAIHRDGFSEGPEVVLCDHCGGYPHPTCEEIWVRLSERKQDGAALELVP